MFWIKKLKKINVKNNYQICTICKGSGKLTPIDPKKKNCTKCNKCPYCKGTGILKISN